MKKSLPCLMLLGVLLLVGCASKKDANEKNFSEALNSYLAKKGQICLGIPSAVAGRSERSRAPKRYGQGSGNGRSRKGRLGALSRDGNRIHAAAQQPPR